jgi:hypothetical protein
VISGTAINRGSRARYSPKNLEIKTAYEAREDSEL